MYGLNLKNETAMYEFEKIKDNVRITDVAERYGIKVHNGMCCCPFHNEKNPSMKLYEKQDRNDNFYCFGCHKSGDAVGLTAGIFNISQLEAAKKLDNDFGLGVFRNNSQKKSDDYETSIKIRKQEEEWVNSALKITSEYIRILGRWQEWYSPQSPESQLNPLFAESIMQKDYAEYIFDKLIQGLRGDNHKLYTDNKQAVMKIAQRLKEIYSDNLHKSPVQKEYIQKQNKKGMIKNHAGR